MTRLGKPFPALLAFVRAFVCVRPGVVEQISGRAERLGAIRALELLLLGVCELVSFEVTRLTKRLVTLGTFVRSFSCVGQNVGLQVAVGFECLLAELYWTGKGFNTPGVERW